MNVRVRRTAIVNLARTSGLASVENLSDHFGISSSTIRRDLAVLTREGKIARTYGGAISLLPHPEASLSQRQETAYAAKQSIGSWAAGEVMDGETILLDAGTTTGALAQKLSSRKSLTVVTTGMTALTALSNSPDIELLLLGGRLRAVSQGFVGPLAEAALGHMTFDRAFMGADAVHPDYGICEANLEQTRLKELMMQRANRVYVLAHGMKLAGAPFHAWAAMPAEWTLVTDATAAPESLALFRARGVRVEIAGVSSQQ